MSDLILYIIILVTGLILLLGAIFFLIKMENKLHSQNLETKKAIKQQEDEKQMNEKKEKIVNQISKEINTSYENVNYKIYELSKEILAKNKNS